MQWGNGKSKDKTEVSRPRRQEKRVKFPHLGLRKQRVPAKGEGEGSRRAVRKNQGSL